MQEFSVLLEGLETDGKGFFMNFNVVAISEDNARKITFEKAKDLGLINFEIDEIESGRVVAAEGERILNVSGKSYYSE